MRKPDLALPKMADPLLSAEEERHLATLARSGDGVARARLIRSNIRLAARIAQTFHRSDRVSPADLFGFACVGLIRAADKFDPAVGTRFSTYASYWVKQSVRRAIQTDRLVAVPLYLEPAARRIARGTAKPTDLRPGMAECLDAAGRVRNARPGRDDSRLHGLAARTPDPAAALEHAERAELVAHLLANLDDRARGVIVERFGLDGGEPATLKQVAGRLGLTGEGARKLELRALDAMRAALPLLQEAS